MSYTDQVSKYKDIIDKIKIAETDTYFWLKFKVIN